MTVVVMVMRTDGFQLWRSAASMRRLAAGCFELDGCVMDAEAFAQGAVEAFEDGSAL